MDLRRLLLIHGTILCLCSVIGFWGHYYQFGIFRLTPWIPSLVGLTLISINLLFDKKLTKIISILMVVAFGVLTTLMMFRFLPEEYQPLRKKIIFSMMSLSFFLISALIIARYKIIFKK